MVFKEGNEQKQSIPHHIFITLLCILCFYNSLENGLVHDDVFAIQNNKDVTTENSIWKLFENDFWGRNLLDRKSHKSFRPLCTLTFKLNYFVNGLNPMGYHLVNLILHLAVSNLYMFILSNIIFKKLVPSFIAASLFSCHPVHVEAVTGVVGRADVLSCLLILLTFYYYARLLKEENVSLINRDMFLVILCGSCAFFVKEHSVMIFLACAKYDIVMNRTIISRKNLSSIKDNDREKTKKNEFHIFLKRITFLLTWFGLLIQFRMYLMDYTLPTFKEEDNPASFSPHLKTRVLTYLYLIVFNLKLLIHPVILCYDWQIGSIPLVKTFSDPRNLESGVMLFAFGVLFFGLLKWFLYRGRKQDEKEKETIVVGLLFLIIPFLPASNFFIRVGFVVAERILYISSLGFFILIAVGFDRLVELCDKNSIVLKSTLYAFLVLMVATFCCKTISYNRVWFSRETLFRSGVDTLPHNAKAHYNYANFLKDENELSQAIHHYKEAVRLYPPHSSSHNNLGTLLQDVKKIQEAEFHFKEAIKHTPGHYRAMLNLANIYRAQNKNMEAYEILERCLRLKPKYFDGRYLLADTFHILGRNGKALTLYEELVVEQRNNEELQRNFATLLQDLGFLERSISVYTGLLAKKPKDSSLLIDLAIVYQKAGQSKMAAQLYERVITYQAEYTKAYQNLAALQFKQGEYEKAKEVYERMMKYANPTNDHIRNYAIILFTVQKQQDAIALVERMISEKPSDLKAHLTLINFLLELNDNLKASVAIERALKIEPTNLEVLLQKANTKRNLKEYEKAKSIYKLLIASNPQNFDALMNLGTVYHIQKEYMEAMSHYEAALKIHPNSSILLENIKKLKRLMK